MGESPAKPNGTRGALNLLKTFATCASMTFRKRILLIDNEPHLTALVRQALETTHRYQIREENDSRRALQAARHFRPDLILLDVIMPNLDGGDVAQLIHADASLQHVPIVFLSSLPNIGEISLLGFFSGYRFLAKPFRLDNLIRCVAEILDNEIAA